MGVAQAVRAWDRYWFRPGSLGELALTRVVLVGFQLTWLLISDIDQRILERAAGGPASESVPVLSLLVLALPVGGVDQLDLETVRIVVVVGWISGVMALAGAWTRPSLGVFAWSQALVLAWIYSASRLHHPEALLVLALMLLTLSPAGARLSVDGWLRGASGRTSRDAAWVPLLLRWLLALAYFSAATSKLWTGGLEWMNGYTLQYFTFVKGTALDRPLGVWLSTQHELARLLSIFTILFETLFFLVLVRPRLSRLFVVAGTGLHVGIFLCIGAPFFQFIALYVVFLSALRPARLEALRRLPHEGPRRAANRRR